MEIQKVQLVLLMGECNKFNNDEAVISEFRDGERGNLVHALRSWSPPIEERRPIRWRYKRYYKNDIKWKAKQIKMFVVSKYCTSLTNTKTIFTRMDRKSPRGTSRGIEKGGIFMDINAEPLREREGEREGGLTYTGAYLSGVIKCVHAKQQQCDKPY